MVPTPRACSFRTEGRAGLCESKTGLPLAGLEHGMPSYSVIMEATHTTAPPLVDAASPVILRVGDDLVWPGQTVLVETGACAPCLIDCRSPGNRKHPSTSTTHHASGGIHGSDSGLRCPVLILRQPRIPASLSENLLFQQGALALPCVTCYTDV